MADRSQKTQKICVLPSVGKDPEAHRSEMIKKEEDRLRAMIRKENKQRRVKDRSYSRNPLIPMLDDDDDESISISKIKNQYKKGSSYSNARYSDSEEEEEEEDNIEDDDDDSDLVCIFWAILEVFCNIFSPWLIYI